MPSLKSLKLRIASVKSTQKITKAMKLVAASKLRRAQEAAEAARPYASKMADVMASIAGQVQQASAAPKLLVGTGADQVHLLLVCTSERGMCGGFNANIVKAVRNKIEELTKAGKTVKILCVGRKGKAALQRSYAPLIIDTVDLSQVKKLGFANAQAIADKVFDLFEAGSFDKAWLFYSRFQSALAQIPQCQQLIPVALEQMQSVNESTNIGPANTNSAEYEPDEEHILEQLLPRNVSVQIFKALLENAASEQGARMTAMDNATRNAGDMIKRVTLVYNRTRQAMITKELIEIISGAEAL
jgi:F-type H+-transporting ATPase subunit gamma